MKTILSSELISTCLSRKCASILYRCSPISLKVLFPRLRLNAFVFTDIEPIKCLYKTPHCTHPHRMLDRLVKLPQMTKRIQPNFPNCEFRLFEIVIHLIRFVIPRPNAPRAKEPPYLKLVSAKLLLALCVPVFLATIWVVQLEAWSESAELSTQYLLL